MFTRRPFAAPGRILRTLVTIALVLLSGPAFGQSFIENFDNITTLTTSGWFIQNNSQPLGSQPYFQGNPAVFSAWNGATAGYIAVNYFSGAGTATLSNWLVTPNRTYRNGDVFTFYTRKVSTPPDLPDRLEVRLSTNGSSTNVGTLATDVGDFTTLLLSVNPTLVTGVYPLVWTQYTITLSGLPAPTSGRIAFRYHVTNGGPTGANSDYIGIDAVEYTAYVCPTITVTPSSQPAGTVGVPYSQSFGQTGALGTPNFAVNGGMLPPGLALSASGTLSGTPNTASGSGFNLTVTASDASGCSGSGLYNIPVSPGAASVSLSDLTPTYDATPHAVTVTTVPVLPTNVTYTPGPGAPTNAGSYGVVATVTDPNWAGSASDTLVIAQLALGVTADPQSKVAGTPDPPLTYQLTSGSLAGSDAFSGVLGRAPGETAGTYAILQGTLTAGANYALGYSGADLTIGQTGTGTAMNGTPSPANVGASVQLTATVTANLPSTTIPTGTVTFTEGAVTLCSATLDAAGVGSCSFTAGLPLGAHNLTATYGGDVSCIGSAGSFTLSVSGTAPVFTSAANAAFAAGAPGSFLVTTTGIPAASLLITGGTLPAGLVFTDNGDGTATISGTPDLAAFGNHTITITASNPLSDAPQVLTIAIAGSVVAIPALDGVGLVGLVLAMAVVAMVVLRRRRA